MKASFRAVIVDQLNKLRQKVARDTQSLPMAKRFVMIVAPFKIVNGWMITIGLCCTYRSPTIQAFRKDSKNTSNGRPPTGRARFPLQLTITKRESIISQASGKMYGLGIMLGGNGMGFVMGVTRKFSTVGN